MAYEIAVNGRRLFGPGDRVRFVNAPAIDGTIDSTTIHGAEYGTTVYAVCWYDDGKRHCETVGEREVEATPCAVEANYLCQPPKQSR